MTQIYQGPRKGLNYLKYASWSISNFPVLFIDSYNCLLNFLSLILTNFRKFPSSTFPH